MDPIEKSTEIIQHWWNYDPIAKRYFDTTIFDDAVAHFQVDYVCDLEIKNGAMKIFSEINSNVGKDLFYINGVWHVTAFSEDGNPEIHEIPDLSIGNILYFRQG